MWETNIAVPLLVFTVVSFNTTKQSLKLNLCAILRLQTTCQHLDIHKWRQTVVKCRALPATVQRCPQPQTCLNLKNYIDLRTLPMPLAQAVQVQPFNRWPDRHVHEPRIPDRQLGLETSVKCSLPLMLLSSALCTKLSNVIITDKGMRGE